MFKRYPLITILLVLISVFCKSPALANNSRPGLFHLCVEALNHGFTIVVDTLTLKTPEKIRMEIREETIKYLEVLNDFWAAEFRQFNLPFSKIKVVFFDHKYTENNYVFLAVEGPQYWSKTHTLYLPYRSWEYLENLSSRKVRTDRAAVIAHEYGHHIQELLKTHLSFNTIIPPSNNKHIDLQLLSELHADALAGYWLAKHDNDNFTNSNRLETLNLFFQLGDNRIMDRLRTAPQQFYISHGTSSERFFSAKLGFTTKDFRELNLLLQRK